MKCDVCNENVATVHVTEIVQKEKRESHLCEECARRQKVTVQVTLPETDDESIEHPPMVTPTKVVLQRDEASKLRCPVCGITFAEFRQSGRLGCANDYVVFRRGLVPLLEKIHGNLEHKGKIPVHATERLERQKQIVALRRQLNEAIQKEAYEDAARLRDEIYALEEQVA